MKIIKDREFGGERPLFGLHGARLENVVITDGESAVKHCSDIEAYQCRFFGKYPWWHVDRSVIDDCYFAPASRSAIWYCSELRVTDSVIDGPKFFREIDGLIIHNTDINDADETFWKCNDIEARDLRLKGGTYPFMFCNNVKVDGLQSDAKYIFQYCKNVDVRNARITTKDSFWECENVTVRDSVLDGEYLAWHSKNVRLINCHISGEQPLCYVDNLVLENCTFDASCDRAFEYSTVNADIRGHIENIKNPTSGRIVADSIGSVTIDEHVLSPNDCIIELRKS